MTDALFLRSSLWADIPINLKYILCYEFGWNDYPAGKPERKEFNRVANVFFSRLVDKVASRAPLVP